MRYIKNIALVVVVLLLLVGCVDNNRAELLGSGKTVVTSLALEVQGLSVVREEFLTESTTKPSVPNNYLANDEPKTRALVSELDDVWVLQFDNTGNNISTTKYASIPSGTHFSPALVSIKQSTIYVVANSSVTNLSLTNPATLTAFENNILYKEPANANKIPLVAKLSNVTVADLGDGTGKIILDDENVLTLKLARLLAEVILDLSVHVNTYKLTSAELFNVPVGTAYGLSDLTTTFPDNSTSANFTSNVPPLSVTPKQLDNNTYKWLICDNRRGSVFVTKQSDRNNLVSPANSTFIRVTLTNNGDTDMQMLYDIYLGDGSLVNFDVVRNHTYNVTAKIAGANTYHESLIFSDNRVHGVSLPIFLTDNRTDAPFLISRIKNESGALRADSVEDYCLKLKPLSTWHSPTQSELILLRAYNSALDVDEQLTAKNYWSSTKTGGTTYKAKRYYLSFENGVMDSIAYDSSLVGRCITDPPRYIKWKYPRVDFVANAIVSRDSEGGIKAAALLNDAEKLYVNGSGAYTEEQAYNKISPKFRVALKNGTTTVGDITMTWGDAFAACKAYSEVGYPVGKWRLPTQRELMLMWVMKAELTGPPERDVFYWSGTNLKYSSSGHAWGVDVPTGVCTSNQPSIKANVRCVIDIPQPI